MNQYADIYIAVKTRSKKQAIEFLNHFLPERIETTDAYEFPQYLSQTDIEFRTVYELMAYLETSVNSEYNLYWKEISKEYRDSIESMPGWGCYIKLNSLWQLGFCEGATCTDALPNDSSYVKWIFKRKPFR